jgi:ABC-type amino acid transport substrate-binding protein
MLSNRLLQPRRRKRHAAERAAFLSGPLYATKDAGTGEFKGVAVDLGRSLAGRVGVPVQPVVYASPAAIIAGAKAGEWDVAFMGMNAERAAAVDFSAPYMEVEQGLLVRAGVLIASAPEVDQPGMRIDVLEKPRAKLCPSIRYVTITRSTERFADEAGMLSRIHLGLREISASTTIVARYGVIASHCEAMSTPCPWR